ncbi:MAG: hypothetical protein O3A68_09735 [Proteobacteria bacterium]|nr:hypothetical protein [Pseudomonadota bacterium]
MNTYNNYGDSQAEKDLYSVSIDDLRIDRSDITWVDASKIYFSCVEAAILDIDELGLRPVRFGYAIFNSAERVTLVQSFDGRFVASPIIAMELLREDQHGDSAVCELQVDQHFNSLYFVMRIRAGRQWIEQLMGLLRSSINELWFEIGQSVMSDPF